MVGVYDLRLEIMKAKDTTKKVVPKVKIDIPKAKDISKKVVSQSKDASKKVIPKSKDTVKNVVTKAKVSAVKIVPISKDTTKKVLSKAKIGIKIFNIKCYTFSFSFKENALINPKCEKITKHESKREKKEKRNN